MTIKRVLLVEDDIDHAKLAVKILEHYGFEVCWKASGKEAIEACQGAAFDLGLIDILLPDMSGVDVIKNLRKIATMEKVPMIAVTAHAIEGIKEELLAQGFTDCLSKPYTIESFIGIVKKYSSV